MLFVQKYTTDELAQIEKIHEKVAKDCPDYEEELKALLNKHKRTADVPEDDVPEAVLNLMAESFSEPEPEEDDEIEESAEDNGDDDDNGDDSENGDRIEQAEQKLEGLQAALLKTEQKLMDLDSDEKALEFQQNQEIEAITVQWTDTKTALHKHLKGTKAEHKKARKALKDSQKAKEKTFKAEIKALEKAISDAEYELKVLTTRGKIELILKDPDLTGTLKERWIAAEVAKRLDYPIFMAVSERGGKNNSGNYEHVIGEDGSVVEFPDGHPQEGQLVVDQDLVNYGLTKSDLSSIDSIPQEQLCIAEAFVRFAKANSFGFWSSGDGDDDSSVAFEETPSAYCANYSGIQHSRRIDAEYFNLRARQVVQGIRKHQHVRLGDHFTVLNGFPWKSKKFLEPGSDGPPVVRIRNIKPHHIEVDTLSTIEPAYCGQIGYPMARKGNIVVGMDGLKWFYASILDGDCYVNQRVAHLIAKPDATISPEYAAFMINSTFGQAQLLRDMTIATTVGHITNANIRNLLIPTFSEAFHNQTTQRVRDALQHRAMSNALLSEASNAVASQEAGI